MGLPTKHIKHQGPVIASLAATAWSAIRQQIDKGKPQAPFVTPSVEICETIGPRAEDLVRDYIKHVGGDPSSYRGVVPAHFFPQWGFPLAAQTLRGIPYPMQKVLNGGCRLELLAPIPAGEPLRVSARLEDIDDDGRRAVLHQRVVTGTTSVPACVVAHLYAIVPLGSKHTGDKADRGERKTPVRVPQAAKEIAWWRLPQHAGLAFAMLTGDFNPVHWIRPYARAFGFKSTILHGFSTMARALEGINRSRFAGAVDRIATFDVKFTKPLTLPAKVGLYVVGNDVWVGDAPGGPAYLAGSFVERP